MDLARFSASPLHACPYADLKLLSSLHQGTGGELPGAGGRSRRSGIKRDDSAGPLSRRQTRTRKLEFLAADARLGTRVPIR